MDNKSTNPNNKMELNNFNNNDDTIVCSITKNKNFKKTEIIKDDGRYLIYYDFNNR